MAERDRRPEMVGIAVMNLVLSCIFVFARVVTRTVIRPSFGLDDISIIATLLIFIGFFAAEMAAIGCGLGQPAINLSPEQVSMTLRASIVAEVLAVWTYPTGKAAIAFLLMRIFPGTTLRWILWPLVAANAVMFYLNGILLFAECTPLSFLWDRTIPHGNCWNPSVLEDWGYATGSVGAFTDFAFAIVPWFYIARLQMNARQKIAIGFALSAGLFPFICSILKIYYTSTLGSSSDPTYSLVNLYITGQSELCAINIAACIPTLRPLYYWFKKNKVQAWPDAHCSPTQTLDDSDVKRSGGRLNKLMGGIGIGSFDSLLKRLLSTRSSDSGAEGHTPHTNHTTKDDSTNNFVLKTVEVDVDASPGP